MNSNNIFIDTNILIGGYCGIQKDEKALHYLYSLNGKRLYTSSLAIAQFVATLQKKKREIDIRKILVEIVHRIEVLSFTKDDIEKAIKMENDDIEDNMQYSIGSKMKCFYYVTNNIKDYNNYMNIQPLTSEQVKVILK